MVRIMHNEGFNPGIVANVTVVSARLKAPDPYWTDEDTFWELERARLEAAERIESAINGDLHNGGAPADRKPEPNGLLPDAGALDNSR